jgi:serine/threonine protein kinase
MEDWHTAQYPSCNNIHEAFSPIAQMSLVNWGSVSYVMKLTGYNPAIVLKGNKYKRFDDSAHALKSRHKDAIVQEHVSSSAFVASIFGHCGASVLAPLSDSGDLHDYIDSVRGGEGEELDALSKLKIAVHLSSGLAALHGLKSEPNATYTASYVHNDLDVSQYINHNGIFQLNDFNLGKFIQKRKGDSSVRACFGSPGMSTAMYRAPEDVAYLLARKGRNVRNKKLAELVKGKKVPFDYSKADVFSLGTAMYMLLTNKWMWELRDVHASLLKLIQGERPPIPDKYSNMALNNLSGTAVEVNHETTPRHNTTSSNNTTLLHPAVLLHNNATEAAATKAIIAAIDLCWVHEPTERASAYKVAAFLNQQLKILLRLPENEPVPLDTLRVTMPPIEDGPQDYDNVMMAW